MSNITDLWTHVRSQNNNLTSYKLLGIVTRKGGVFSLLILLANMVTVLRPKILPLSIRFFCYNRDGFNTVACESKW
jgi:hypothetical protein